MAMKQATRVLSLKTPLAENELVMTGFSGNEEMSRLFRFQLDMISDNNGIKAADIVGKNITFNIKLADGSQRYFNGFVNRFLAGDEDDQGRRDYRAEVVPWLWFLTQTADCRIFQNTTVPEIIEQIFMDLGFSDFELDIRGSHKKWEYCVQYRETDFNFVSRLAEQEGIFYYFRHANGKHVLVLADQKNAYKDCPEKEVDYPRDVGVGAYVIEDHITSWEHRYDFCTGKVAHTDFNFETPSTNLMTNTNTLIKLPDVKKYEIYDYPGEYLKKPDGESEIKVRMEEQEVEHDMVAASSLCKTFTPGGKFKIRKHHCATEEGKSYVVTSITHLAHEPTAYETGSPGGQEYSNNFSAIPESVVFRPARITPKPLVSGVQTAIVVGPAGEEIYPDKYGRVKVQFHWDREGRKDENSSCWMRVSQVHAGKGFGGIDIPRIGEEVIVDFLEGDPDRPIIIGRVYHAENMPPFGLPGGKNISGLKSNSTKGGGGYNEFVLDDTKGNELIRVHGQFDMDSTIEHDLREHVLNDRSRDVTNNETILIGNDQTSHIKANRTETVDKDETITIHGNRTETVDKEEKITIGGGRTENVAKEEKITIGGGRTESVGKDEKISIGGGRTESVAKDEKISIGGGRSESVAKDETVTVSGGRTHSVGKDDSLSVGKNLVVTAADSISLTTGQASIVMKKDGTISITGKDITITGSGQITGKASKDMVLKGKKILQN